MASAPATLALRTGSKRIKLLRAVLIVAVLLAAAPFGVEAFAAEPKRLRIDVPNYRWQALPREVTSVTIGPDQRVWHQLVLPLAGTPAVPQAEAQAAIELEFKNQSPQIRGAELALLDHAGRAWFYFEHRRKLLGYDGERWIEPTKLEDKEYFRGRVPTLGTLRSGGPMNCSAGSRVFFFGQTGILSYDGEQWDFLKLPDEERRPYPLLFAASPNGKWVVAASKKTSGLLVLRDGEWKPHDAKFEVGEVLGSIVVTDEGVVWRLDPRKPLTSFRLGGDEEEQLAKEAPTKKAVPPVDPRAEFESLVKKLDDDSFNVRSNAQAELSQLGPEMLPQVEAALAVSKSLEQQERLRNVIAALKQKRRTPASRPKVATPVKPSFPLTRFGNVQVGGVMWLQQDSQGRVFVGAQATVDSEGQPSGPALAILEGRTTTVVTDPALVRLLRPFSDDAPLPITTAGGKQLWIPQPASHVGPALVDLEESRLVREIPDADYRYLRGVDEAGRVYLTKESFSRSLVMVYSSDKEEDRLALETRSKLCDHNARAVAADGTVWAGRSGDGLYYFGGVGWQKVEEWKHPGSILACGGNGEVLVATKTLSLWRQGEKLKLESKNIDLKEFIRTNHEAMAAAFAGPHVPLVRPLSSCSIVADRFGNIWLLEQSRLSVLMDDRWQDAAELLKEAGSRGGDVWFIASVGDGSRVYVSDMKLAHESGRSFLGQIEDGELLLTKATHAAHPLGNVGMPLRDPRGDLWIGGNITKIFGPSEYSLGQFVARLNEMGTADEIKTRDRLVLIEGEDRLWFAETFFKPSGTITRMQRDGKVLQKLELPQVDSFYHFFSDRPGSVYAVSSRGLEHLVATDPDGNEYRHAATYNLSGIAKGGELTTYSKLGYFVIASADRDNVPYHRLHLIRIPKGP